MPQRRSRQKGRSRNSIRSRNNVRNPWSARSRKNDPHLSRLIIRHPLRKKRRVQRRSLPITLPHRHVLRRRRIQHLTLHRSRSSTMITITTGDAQAA
jgi:hypothetical protein